jgi:hypothetical protein
MSLHSGNDLNLGSLTDRNAALVYPSSERDKHLYICGTTGMGKSKLLEHLVRQDIKNWKRSKCGVMVLDPHGNLYDNLIQWLAWNKQVLDVPVIPIDLRQDEWVVSYNLLRQRKADPAVLIDNLTDAMAYVWGQSGTNQTPLFARWVGNILRALYEKQLTLVDAEHLIDRFGKQLRYSLTSNMQDKSSRQDWEFADSLNAKDFEAHIGSTGNRLQRFIRNDAMRSIFGQPQVSLDLGKALEEGSIILVSLATEHARVSKTNAELFATLLLNDLWTAAQERGKRDGVKPFYVYLDEFQRFVTPTISDNLDEARGFGLHLTMAHQFPNQLLDRGDNGRRVYNSIMENASSKIVFRLSHEDNLRAMAQWLFMGVMDPDEIKHKLFSTKVMQYREEMKEVFTESSGTSGGHGQQNGYAWGEGAGGTMNLFDGQETLEASESFSNFRSESGSKSDFRSQSESISKSLVPMLVPVFGKELAHLQFRSLEEQLFRAMAVLFDQKERQGVARLVGMSAPVSIITPNVNKAPASTDMTKRYLESCYEKLPFALPYAKAQQQLLNRADTFKESLLKEEIDAPIVAGRKISSRKS